MVAYVVEQLDPVAIQPGSPVDGMDWMSPYVWREDAGYRMLLRAVPRLLKPKDPTGVIASGRSDDGLAFRIDEQLAICPDSLAGDEDAGGCEDPTVVQRKNGRYLIYYTGVDATRSQGSLLLATGPSLSALTTRELVLKAPEGEGNIKEATLAQAPDRSWRLFYEYAEDKSSRIGIATGPSPAGPWTSLPDPFTVRADAWDNWHLSTGPIITPPGGGDPVMFYNGATADARWRIGWISFNADFTRVTGRGIEPVLVPPPPVRRDCVDIAFAASALIEGDMIALYYSLEDMIPARALIRRYT